ncbi:uncharacterized protein LOC115981322 [Quercus lobata]|uniref:uncharacterized protein LOC115981322 n=1 Tax=Quercus lobata TaxID=97700 RepID=UPI001246805E|nr:uncharacterized protein LOC115981322 [Quercus lobata]
MQWMWVNGAGPFMTNGEFREVTESSSATESDFETMIMFNLDRLNEDRPEWLCGFAWERAQYSDPNSLHNPIHAWLRVRKHSYTQTVSLDTGLDTIRPSGVADTDLSFSSPTSVRLEPGVLGYLGCDQELGNLFSSSRKRIGTNLGRFGRNIHQKLMCGFFTKEGAEKQSQTGTVQEAGRAAASDQEGRVHQIRAEQGGRV